VCLVVGGTTLQGSQRRLGGRRVGSLRLWLVAGAATRVVVTIHGLGTMEELGEVGIHTLPPLLQPGWSEYRAVVEIVGAVGSHVRRRDGCGGLGGEEVSRW